MTILRIIFSTRNPIHTLHLLKTEIPYETSLEYIEYLDVYEAIKEQSEKEAKDKAQNNK